MKKMHLATVLAVALILIPAIAANSQAIEIKFTNPTDGGSVNQTQTIEGIFKNITDFKKMRIVVYIPDIDSYHPQDNRFFKINVYHDGTWRTKAIIGDQYNSGNEFQLLATVADESANAQILSYLDKSNNAHYWPGIDTLPRGTAILDRITVIRR